MKLRDGSDFDILKDKRLQVTRQASSTDYNSFKKTPAKITAKIVARKRQRSRMNEDGAMLPVSTELMHIEGPDYRVELSRALDTTPSDKKLQFETGVTYNQVNDDL